MTPYEGSTRTFELFKPAAESWLGLSLAGTPPVIDAVREGGIADESHEEFSLGMVLLRATHSASPHRAPFLYIPSAHR